MVLYQSALLILTLFCFDSETGRGTALYHLSSDLVSAVAEIHHNCSLQDLQQKQAQENVRHYALQNLYLLHSNGVQHMSLRLI